MPTSQNSNSTDHPLCPSSEQAMHAAETAELADLNDLARFEGEGGREPTTPDWVDVPLDSHLAETHPGKSKQSTENTV
jgi:hypothetical protein